MSNTIRDGVAEAIGGLFSGIGDVVLLVFDNVAAVGWVGGGLLLVLVLWRLSLSLAPQKLCPYCKAKGHWSSPLGGVRVCGFCKGSGRRNRIGAK